MDNWTVAVQARHIHCTDRASLTAHAMPTGTLSCPPRSQGWPELGEVVGRHGSLCVVIQLIQGRQEMSFTRQTWES